jgi:hypothetical protein
MSVMRACARVAGVARVACLSLLALCVDELPPPPSTYASPGNQAVQMVAGGLKAIYLSGWQVAADANTAGQTYPDQSLYPADSVPKVVERINNVSGAPRSEMIWGDLWDVGIVWGGVRPPGFAPLRRDGNEQSRGAEIPPIGGL